jgi:hypothetical protein
LEIVQKKEEEMTEMCYTEFVSMSITEEVTSVSTSKKGTHYMENSKYQNNVPPVPTSPSFAGIGVAKKNTTHTDTQKD